MSVDIKPFCVFCFKKSENLISFSENILEKCNNILVIRKNNGLSMNNAKVPKEINNFQKYHSKCYRLFSALPKKYRSNLQSETASTVSRMTSVSIKDEPISDEEYFLVVNNTDIDPLDYTAQEKQIIIENQTNSNESIFFETKYVEQEDDVKLKKLLKEFDLEIIYPDLMSAGVTFRCLKYLKKDDIASVIKHMGYRVEFREKLFMWRKKEYNIEDESSCNLSKVTDWLKEIQSLATLTPLATPSTSTQSNVDIRDVTKSDSGGTMNLSTLLRQTSRGRIIFAFYTKNDYLSNKKRDELIEIIVDDIIFNNKKLEKHNFLSITKEIISIFPNEEKYQDYYYYIPRQPGRNPGGKLYSKYANERSKKKKLEILMTNKESEKLDDNQPEILKNEEIDEFSGNALKISLKKENEDWREVCDMWEKTFSMRQDEMKKISTLEFLEEWPKLKKSGAPQLINMDFKLMHPEKDSLLKNKWNHFKKQIEIYYETNINNFHCRQIFLLAKRTKNTDAKDYIFTTLLNSVLPPSARFKDSKGTNVKRPSIQDATESFILILPTINDYDQKVRELRGKYYQSGLIHQPFLIVVGSGVDEITSFFIYFDKIFYRFDSFIESLDTCFKIYQVFSFKYPKICELPWVFIQKYFYEINTSYDLKSSKLISLLSFLSQ